MKVIENGLDMHHPEPSFRAWILLQEAFKYCSHIEGLFNLEPEKENAKLRRMVQKFACLSLLMKLSASLLSRSARKGSMLMDAEDIASVRPETSRLQIARRCMLVGGQKLRQ